MIKYKGTTLFPKTIFEVLEKFSEISCYKVLVNSDELGNDDITILLESKLDKQPVLSEIENACKSKLRVLPKIELIETNELRGMVYQKHLRKPEKIKFNR